ncbi:hypothetical protein BKA57DRAFT_477647 [Linnemannia elongata]|nr:hypothetical protein BKA57DRAFT_477647 [Linnemannia elongata]
MPFISLFCYPPFLFCFPTLSSCPPTFFYMFFLLPLHFYTYSLLALYKPRQKPRFFHILPFPCFFFHKSPTSF